VDVIGKLRAEADRLEQDLQMTRASIGEVWKNSGDQQRAIAALTKEHRYYLTALQNAQTGIDRRGLMTAGADRLLQALEEVFSSNEEALAAIRETMLNVAESISEES
jgi:hypothetical protein